MIYKENRYAYINTEKKNNKKKVKSRTSELAEEEPRIYCQYFVGSFSTGFSCVQGVLKSGLCI